MKINISQLKSSLIGKTGGRKLTNIPNFNEVVQETINSIMSRVTLNSSYRKTALLATYKGLPYLRELPRDCATGGFIDAFNRDYTDVAPLIRTGMNMTEFRTKVGNGLIGVEYIDGIQYLNIQDTRYNNVYTLDSCDDATNGDWVAVGDANTISFDTTNYINGEGSLQFYSSATTGDFGVEKSNFADVISAEDRDYIVMQMFFPIYVTGVTIRYGIDSTNYHEVTISRDYLDNRFRTGWNTLAFDLSTKTTTGTVGNDNVTYLSIFMSQDLVTAPTAPFRIDSIYFTDGYSYDLTYVSNSIVCDSYGTRRPNNLIASDSDYVLMDEREKQLFLHAFSTITAIDNRPDSGMTEYNVYARQLEDEYARYSMEFPSQKILMSNEY